jgi:hypothetical protein
VPANDVPAEITTPISFGVLRHFDEMEKQALLLALLADNVFVKIPSPTPKAKRRRP